MTELRREVGFLRALGQTKLSQLVWPEGVAAALVGLGGGVLLLNSTTSVERVAIVGDCLAILGVLLGVVFAAFALMIAFFSDEYLRTLDRGVQGGAIAFIRPFLIAVGLQVTAVFLTIGYRAAATDLDSRVEVGWFLVWAFLFAFVLVDVVALARAIAMHALTRARMLHPAADEDRPVSPMRGRR
jgi:hypothetical protein